jgi:2-polyprenyl-6-methoxyphenol hydroxylase-like FAD-dependent oxidoreductase
MDSYDVVIVGYGPTGSMLAVKLGRCGWRVLVLEQQNASYPLPRAAHLDDEVCRMLQGIGIPPSGIPDVIEPYEDFCEWRNAAGDPLLRLDWRGRGPSGWNVSNFFHQPALEDHVRRLASATGNVTVRRGHQAVSHASDCDGVTVHVIAGEDAYQVRHAGEDPVVFGTVATAWQLLRPWGVSPENASLVRQAMYTFQARWAEQWRNGRLILAGDAAHQMPPFAGQGMCSGLRDVMNLYWKLDLVLRDADDSLLDTYGSERSGHVRDFIGFSMELGDLICATDPEAVRARDARMKAEAAEGSDLPPRPLPRLGPGLHTGQGCAGTVAPQGIVRAEHAQGLLDDVIGPGGALIGPAAELSGVTSDQRSALAAVGISSVGVGVLPGADTVVDVDGTYAAWLAQCAARAVLVRPDFYVYGAAAGDLTAPDLVRPYLGRLQ